MLRPCLGCGKPTQKPRCPDCQRRQDAQRNRSKSQRYSYQWQKLSREIRAAWVEAHGWWCPGYGPTHPPHPSTDLVVDHDRGVMCRAANAIKANTVDRGR